jgi:hypothetical protein
MSLKFSVSRDELDDLIFCRQGCDCLANGGTNGIGHQKFGLRAVSFVGRNASRHIITSVHTDESYLHAVHAAFRI